MKFDKWYKQFAWYPVKTDDGNWVWFKTVVRINTLTYTGGLLIRYKTIDKFFLHKLKNNNLYPNWICQDCALINGGRLIKNHIATFHTGYCDICKRKRVITEPRDYGHLKDFFIK